MVILPQCRATLLIGKPGKTCGAFLPFAASSLQRMRGKQLAVSIPTHTRGLSSVATCNVVNDPRDLSSVAIYQVRSTRNTRGLSRVATCNVVNDPRDLSSVAIYQVRSTRNVNIPPHPTPAQPTLEVSAA